VVPALGYILGDEGSGSYFGKKLLSSYLYHKLPSHIAEDFEKIFHLSKDNIVENVYKKPNANVYIASFMPFIAKHREENFFKVMVEEGMRNFMEVHVCCYPNYKEVPVHFVGSIAQIFDREVEKAANSLGIKIGQIIQKPIQGLVSYHQNYILNKQLN
jgi:N-acetylglucosamine kinase-like BadF-type ATPase